MTTSEFASSIRATPRIDDVLARGAILVILIAAQTSFLCFARGESFPIDPAIEKARDSDPVIEPPREEVIWFDSYRSLWRQALEHDEADTQREAADTIAYAHRLGMNGLEETTPALLELLNQPNLHPVVRLAATRALVELDARQAAGQLAAQAERGPIAIAQLAEPALARWDHRPMRDVWLERLNDSGNSLSRVRLAIDGLAAVKETRAIDPLVKLASSPHPSPALRIAAARGAANLDHEGLVDVAKRLYDGGTLVDRLVASQLLARHSSAPAIDLLDHIAEDAEGAVASLAMQRLLEVDPKRLVARADTMIGHRDSRIRMLAVQGLATSPSSESIAKLAPRLDDRVPEIRYAARRTLLTMAADESLHGAVVEQVAHMLDGEAWRGVEQSILILTTLDQRQTTPRLFEHLRHDHPAVYVTAAWGLRRLATPESIGDIFTAAQRLSSDFEESDARFRDAWAHAQLLEALGQQRHLEAEEHLRKFIPKASPYDPEARAAAIWSLGHLLADSPDAALARQLEARLADTLSVPAEDIRVRTACAVTLGRMRQEDSIPFLREWVQSDTGLACAWALHHMTGEPLPKVKPTQYRIRGWFLEPVRDEPDFDDSDSEDVTQRVRE